MFTKLKTVASAVAVATIGLTGNAYATPPSQALPYFTPSDCTPNCWDFTIYTSSTPQTVIPGTSLGYVEGFMAYDASTVSGNAVNATLKALYFTSTGIGTAGATTSLWAPIVNLNLSTQVPDFSGGTNTVSSGLVGGSTLLQISGSTAYQGVIKTAPAVINFNVDGTSYQAILSNGSKNSSIASLNTDTGQWELLAIGQNYYTSTSPTQNNLGTQSFGGQIAPEMDPQSAFNVFALLGCLALVYSRRKQSSEENSSSAMGSVSIA